MIILPKEDVMEFHGQVIETLPNATSKVKLSENGMVILAYISGKMQQHYIRIIPGDKVLVEVSVYDPSRGRITRRL